VSDFPPYFCLGLSHKPLQPQMDADKRRKRENKVFGFRCPVLGDGSFPKTEHQTPITFLSCCAFICVLRRTADAVHLFVVQIGNRNRRTAI
jgi:hypothetical protein